MTSECPYTPICTSYTPCCQTCQDGGGEYCGKWREFDTAWQLKREKASRRAQLKKSVKTRISSVSFLVMSLTFAWLLTWGSGWILAFDVVMSAGYLAWFIVSIGEWTK